jgi:bifunctional N-acetylglucosamine-1-phosphate-uridyltransferase/glucosamine-1-phosphate-acetyltransferase GlmU-like protein
MAANVLAIPTTYTVRDDYQQVESRGEGDGVLIGSNGAPIGHITVGGGAIVGGGSSVQHDVPASKHRLHH